MEPNVKEAIKVIDKLATLMGGALGEAWPVIKEELARQLTKPPEPTVPELSTEQKIALVDGVLAAVVGNPPPKLRRGRTPRETATPAAAAAVSHPATTETVVPHKPAFTLAPVPIAAAPEVGVQSPKSVADDFDTGFTANLVDAEKASALVEAARRRLTRPPA